MERWEHEVVVGVALGSQTVGVVRKSDGTFLFGGRVDIRGGVVLTDFTPHGRTIDGRTVVAGRRLPNVERVLVIDDRGDEYEAVLADEAWVAIASDAGFSEPLARYEDSGGGLVSLPLPAGRRSRVEDADSPCPICGNEHWIEIDDRVHCERCGLQVGAGLMFVGFGAGSSAPGSDWVDVDDEEDDWEAEQRREHEAVMASARFPVYGVSGREYELASYGGEPGKSVRSVSLSHADGARFVQVDSRVEQRWIEDDQLRERLARLGDSGRWPDDFGTRSEAALRVHLTHVDRTARRRAAQSERTTRGFVIDGDAEPFAFIALADAWVARRDHYGVTLELTARGVDPDTVELARVAGAASSAAQARRAQAGQLLTRAEVEHLIEAHGQASRREEVLAGIRPGYRMTEDPGSTHRIGGEPDLAPGEQWPHDEDGIPYTFLAQIDCSQLAPIDSEFSAPAWDHGGRLLRFFTPLDGYVPEPGVAVALACDPDAPLTRTPVPPRPDPMPPDAWEPDEDHLRELDEVPVRLTPFLTTREDTYENPLAAALLAGGAPTYSDEEDELGPQLLGHTTNVQGEDPAPMGHWVYEDTAEDDWCLLLHLTPSLGMDLGDGGDLSILIRYDDLAAGRYDRLATDISMG